MTGTVLAVDPGRQKSGIAILRRTGQVLYREISSTATLLTRVEALLAQFRPEVLLLGDRTGSKESRQQFSLILQLEIRGLPLVLVDEHGSTEAARQRYWQENPPRGWRRLIPVGLQVPPCPIDDYAAVILAERYLASTRN